jgi:hypothetical protein
MDRKLCLYIFRRCFADIFKYFLSMHQHIVNYSSKNMRKRKMIDNLRSRYFRSIYITNQPSRYYKRAFITLFNTASSIPSHCVGGRMLGMNLGLLRLWHLVVRRPDNLTRSHPHSARSHPLSARSHLRQGTGTREWKLTRDALFVKRLNPE